MPGYYKMHLDETLKKGIYGGQVQNLSFLSKVSTTKDPLFDVGDTVVLPDGREFRYALSTGASTMIPTMGCNFTDTGYTSYTAFTVAHSVGVSEITLPAATHAALAADGLKGGYLVVFNGSGTNDVTYGIVGNDSSAQNAAIVVRVDMPVAVAITTSSACETYKNPWGAIAQANTVVLPRAGVPVVSVSAAANYFWLQTKGVKFIAPQTGVGNDNGGIMTFWRHDGSVESTDTALAVTTATLDSSQPCGIVIAGSAAGNGPLINLLGY